MSRHKATALRPRYGRISLLGTSLAVTIVAVLGGTGALPTALSGGGSTSAAIARDPAPAPTPAAADPEPSDDASALAAGSTAEQPEEQPEEQPAEQPVEEVDPAADTTLPPDSGQGRRVVFSESRQRVWLVEDDGTVVHTHLASGSLSDNLDPGTYEVYSRSEDAVGIDDSGTMKYFVRFTQGDTGAAIGFHDIPIDDGERVQTYAQLGTPQSHGCIRQRRSDAIAVWDFAPLGTTVVVTA